LEVTISRLRTILSSSSIDEGIRLVFTSCLEAQTRQRFTQSSLAESLEDANSEFSYQFWLFGTTRMSGLSKLFPSDSLILIDGGLVHWLVSVVLVHRLMVEQQGSTLEDVFQIDTASSLWSSEDLINNPESVIEAHLLFLRAGARLIETAS
jgi:hypothetical protein